MQNDEYNDNSLSVNTGVLLELCSKWKSNISGTGLSNMNVASTFSSFTECGVGTSFFTSLDKAIKKVDGIAYNLANAIEATINDQVNVDQNSALDASDNIYGEDTSEGELITDDNTETYSADNKDKDVSIDGDDQTQIAEFDDTQKELSVLLKSFKTLDLIEITDMEDIDEIKNKLLSSPKITAELKEQILAMEENELKTRLVSLFASGNVISDFSLDLINDLNDSLTKLGNKVDLKDSLIKVFDTYSNLQDNDNIQVEIKKIYLNTLDSDEVTIFTKNFVNKISEEKSITAEELLTDNQYKSYINDKVKELNNSSSLLQDKTNGDDHNE